MHDSDPRSMLIEICPEKYPELQRVLNARMQKEMPTELPKDDPFDVYDSDGHALKTVDGTVVKLRRLQHSHSILIMVPRISDFDYLYVCCRRDFSETFIADLLKRWNNNKW